MMLTFDYTRTRTTNELRHFDERNQRAGFSHEIRILALLIHARSDWICGSTFLELYMPTYSQRVSRLVAKGERVESRPCDGSCGRSHSGSVHSYRWLPDD